jgi:hypothetical protein
MTNFLFTLYNVLESANVRVFQMPEEHCNFDLTKASSLN